jgi:hypothetical protein
MRIACALAITALVISLPACTATPRVTLWCLYKATGERERLAEFIGEHGQVVAFSICKLRAEDLNRLAELNSYYCTPASQ